MTIALSIDEQKAQAKQWFEQLRDLICTRFEALEDALASGPHAALPAGRFVRKPWQRNADKTPPEWNEHKSPAEQNAQEPSFSDGGGGVISLMHGRVFEKVGVNVSTVYGTFSESFRARIPGAAQDGRFWASGISLVSHMRSPKVPAVHMNTRMVATSGGVWFGGGTDLTPMLRCDEDTARFHAALKATCDRFNPDYYPKFKAWCDNYFYLPHREEPRGIGGIFFDNLREGSWADNLAFTQAVGQCFADIYPELVRTHMHDSWSDEERKTQLVKRGRYVEFNLLYDRGTTFGLKTGGNVEAILMSLPPEAHWP